MGYLQIAQKHVNSQTKKKHAKPDVEDAADAKQPGDLLEDQVDAKAPTKAVAAVQQPVNKVAAPVKQKGGKTLASAPQPVPGTPFAALSDLLTKRKK